MKELEKNGVNDPMLSDLVAEDIVIQKLAQKEMNRRLTNKPEEISGTDLKWFSEITFKRSQLLSGGATDRVEVIGDVNIV